jgi:ABC-type lipoprotein export system ATPase subunit
MNNFGFSFQNNSLYGFMTIEENLLYPLIQKGEPLKQSKKKVVETLKDFLIGNELKDIKKILRTFPAKLSGGQKQRIALARSIIHDPYVLFADEPTGQLDIKSRQQIMKKLRKWLNDGVNPKTNLAERMLIWVTHHHIGDLELMDLDNLIFVGKDNNPQCEFKNRKWLEDWGRD